MNGTMCGGGSRVRVGAMNNNNVFMQCWIAPFLGYVSTS